MASSPLFVLWGSVSTLRSTAGAVDAPRHLGTSSLLSPATRHRRKYKMGALPPGSFKYAFVEKIKLTPKSHLGRKAL